MNRFKFLTLAALGLTSCNQSPAPPAVVAGPAIVAQDKPEPAAVEPAAKNDSIPDGGTFQFPDDTGGKALAKTLTPAIPPAMPAAAPAAPKERKLPAFLDAPTPPLPDAANSPPRLGLAPIKEARPVPLPAPKTVWTQGQKRWHVDAPILVAGDKVLVASAFLDKEKEGDRAIFCLDAVTGKELWRAPLAQNPWGGPTLAGDTVIVTTSSISYTMKELETAKGEIVALDLATGKEKWKKTVPGGVLGCAAATKVAAVFTCTDGKVRAFDLKDGSRKMIYDAKAPIFAPPAVVGDIAYVADLKGVVHAIDLKTGAATWTLDLASEPVKLPGANYGGITVHGGKLYLATCNLEGPLARLPTVVVCIGGK